MANGKDRGRPTRFRPVCMRQDAAADCCLISKGLAEKLLAGNKAEEIPLPQEVFLSGGKRRVCTAKFEAGWSESGGSLTSSITLYVTSNITDEVILPVNMRVAQPCPEDSSVQDAPQFKEF